MPVSSLIWTGKPVTPGFLSCLDERIEQTERVNLRLQVVIEHGLEGGHLRIHDHDVAGDTVLAQRNTLIGYSHSQIVYTMIPGVLAISTAPAP